MLITILGLLNCVPYVLTCQRALRAQVLTCQRVLRAYVFTYHRALHAYLPTCLACFSVHVPTCLECLLTNSVLRTYMLMCQCVLHVSLFFLNWDSLHGRLNSHYKTWSYKKEKYKKIKVCRKSFQEKPTVKRSLLILDLRLFRSQIKGKHAIGR